MGKSHHDPAVHLSVPVPVPVLVPVPVPVRTIQSRSPCERPSSRETLNLQV